MSRILLVDDEEEQIELLKDILELEKYEVFISENIKGAMNLIRQNDIDIIISDYKLNQETGEEFLEKSNFLYPEIEFILMTAYGTIETAVRCMKKGAFGFLTKPVNIEELKETIKKAYENKQLKEENKKLKQIIKESHSKYNLIGNSGGMNEVKRVIEKVKDIEIPVLLTGETGTGKEMVAKSIHYSGKRGNEPFVAVNMASIPENLIESELFGHIKGSFTGAGKDKKGKFELAGKGTIFLDEIGEMNYDLQSKLLRVLQEGEIQKVGSEKNQKITCRVLAATNRNLKEEIAKGTFREDLYYRLDVVTINIPALRDRKDDYRLLINFFIEKNARKYNIENENMKIYADKIFSKNENYKFPGNVRELENIVERYLIFPDDIDEKSDAEDENTDLKFAGKTLKEIEKEAIRETLEYCEGNRNHAAKMLEISPRGIRYKLKEYGID